MTNIAAQRPTVGAHCLTPGRLEQLAAALRTSAASVNFYERYELDRDGRSLDALVVESDNPTTALNAAIQAVAALGPDASIVVWAPTPSDPASANACPRIAAWVGQPTRKAELVDAVEKTAALAFARRENRRLRRALEAPADAETSPVAVELVERYGRGALDSPVAFLIDDSTAELADLALALHRVGPTRDGGFFSVDCAKSGERLNAILFGSFDRAGLLEIANGGTVAFFNASETPRSAQDIVKNWLKNNRFGKTRLIFCDGPRFVERIASGEFDGELYQENALNRCKVPPLVERPESDVSRIACDELRRVASERGETLKTLSRIALNALAERRWTGGVDELRAVVRNAAHKTPGPIVEFDALVFSGPVDVGTRWAEAGASFAELERRIYVGAIRFAGGNRAQAARALGVSEKTIYNKIKQFKLKGIV